MPALHQAIAIVTPPTAEAVSLPAMKLYLRTDSNAEDETIIDQIAEARDYIEGQTGLALMQTQYRMTLDRFPLTPGLEYYVGTPAIPTPPVNNRWPLDPAAWSIPLLRSPLISIDSFQYVDAGGTTQTLSPSKYTVDTTSLPGRVSPANATAWPVVQFGPGAVTITFTAGYATADLVPPQLKRALKQLVAHAYENREVMGEGRFAELPLAVSAILDNCRVCWL